MMARSWTSIVIPLAALAAVIAFLLIGKPLEQLTQSAPPVEDLVIETVDLTPGLISLNVRADGSEPVVIAQVQVDGAWRLFTATPSTTIGRLGSARIDIPYVWIEGESHHILLLTNAGTGFEHTIDVAIPKQEWSGPALTQLGLIGILLGIVPVTIGLLGYPAIRAAGPEAIRFMLALTIGLLLYLFVDTLLEGLELGSEALGRLRGETVVWISMALTVMALLAAGRRDGKAPEGARLAFFIALGIGLHNLGEGLVVGAALATGAAALATFLVVGFVIHNVTEGIGIAAPLAASEKRPSLAAFVGLAAVAGLPAIAGVLLGTGAVSPYWAALSFGVGAGAILQVIIEVSALMIRQGGTGTLTAPSGASGVIAGLAIMYATALLV
jgi:zinc transporter, ZIP family